MAMDEVEVSADPRWGSNSRDAKAHAILRTLITEVGVDVTSGAWLDVGCGSGLIAAELAKHVKSVHAIDPEPWSRWPLLSENAANLKFHVGSFRSLCDMIPPASIDVVICNQVYEHVDSPAAMLTEIYRVLKPHGVCYFAGPNLLWPIEPHVFLPFVHWLPRNFVIRVLMALGVAKIAELDAWSLDLWRLRALFHDAGFQSKSAFSARARAARDLGEGGLVFRLAAAIPSILLPLILPILPSFIFILRKPPL